MISHFLLFDDQSTTISRGAEPSATSKLTRHTLNMAQYSMVNGTVQFRHEGENTTRTTTVPVSPFRARIPKPQEELTWGLSEATLEIIFFLMVCIDLSAVYVKYRWRRYTCEETVNVENLENPGDLE